MEHQATVVVRLGEAGLERNDAVVVGECCAQFTSMGVAIAQHQQGFDTARIGGDRVGREGAGIGAMALLQQSD
jgi:hypothetical protein